MEHVLPTPPSPEFEWLVGVDWGTEEHAVNVATAAGEGEQEWQVKHTSAGLAQLADRLAARAGGSLARVAVAIEVPRGAVVEGLLERGAAVFAVNPKQLDRFRDRFSPAGAKDDRLDAKTLRSALQTDRQYFRRVVVEEPVVIRLREVARTAAVVQQDLLAQTNRLADLIRRIAPAWLTLSANADDPWFWELLAWIATPALGQRLRRKKVEQLLKAFRIRRVTVDDVLTAVEQPALPVAPGTVEAVTQHIQLLLPLVTLLQDQRRACERELDRVLEEADSSRGEPPATAGGTPAAGTAGAASSPSDVTILRSLPGVGRLITATFVAEASPLLQLRDHARLRLVTGVAPVRRQSGKQKRGTISMRYACSDRLRNACYHLADGSIKFDTAARAYYARLRARGHSHARALRSLADRWLRILCAMLRSRTLYDATRFGTT